MPPDFSKGKIYKITNDGNNDVYVGSTCDRLPKRFNAHKQDAKQEKRQSTPLYKLINQIGFERFRIQLIEAYPCEDKYELIRTQPISMASAPLLRRERARACGGGAITGWEPKAGWAMVGAWSAENGESRFS